MRAGANLPAVGGYNQAVILDAIRRAREGISRVELAARTGLSAQTVSNVTRRLLADGLIREAGTQSAGVGKPRTILELEPRGRFAIGVHLDPSVVTVVMLDLAGSIVAHRTIVPSASEQPTATIERIAGVIAELTDAVGAGSSRVIGAGIAAPGPVDVTAGAVLEPPLLSGWHNVPVRHDLAARTGMPVLLEKDVTAAAVGEVWMSARADRGNMLFFYYGTGVGTGIVVNNEVVRGSSSNAGDVGSLIVRAAGSASSRPTEGAAHRSMLGDSMMPRYLVGDGIVRGVLDVGDEAGRTGAELSSVRMMELFAGLGAAAASGDDIATDILEVAAQDIASGLVTVINLLDTSAVVFGGPFWGAVSGYMLERVPALVRASPVLVSPHPIAFEQSAIGEDVAAVGAACLVLDHAFSPHPAGLLIQRGQ